jgi:hypothetical protein
MAKKLRPFRLSLKTARRLLLFLLLGLLLLLSGLAVLHRPLLRRFVLPRVAELAGAELGLVLEIDDVELVPPATVVLIGISGRPGERRGAIDRLDLARLEIEGSLWGALRGRSDFLRRLRAEALRLEIDLDQGPILPAAPAGAGEGSAIELPALVLERADLLLVAGGERLELRGASGKLEDRLLRLRVEEKGGNWSLPRLEALDFPLEMAARLAAGPEPFRSIHVEELRLGGAPALRDFELDLSEADRVGLRGELTAWSVSVPAGEVAGQTLTLELEPHGAALDSVLELFLEPPLPCRASLAGRLRLELPLDAPELWRARGDLELRGVAWEEPGLTAALVRVRAGRDASGLLSGRLEAEGARLAEIEAPALSAGFEMRFTPGGMEIDVPQAVLQLDGGAALLGFRLVEGESGLQAQSARLVAEALPLSALAGLLPDGAAPDGVLDIELSAGGSLEPFELEGRGDLRLVLWPGTSEETEIAATAVLAGRALSVERAAVRRGADWLRFTASLEGPSPWELRWRPLEGSVAGERLGSSRAASVTFDGARYSVRDLQLEGLGGEVRLEAGGDLDGRGTFRIDVVGIELSPERLRALLPSAASSIDELIPSGRLDAWVDGELAMAPLTPSLDGGLRVSAGRLRVGERIYEGVEGSLSFSAGSDFLRAERIDLQVGGDSLRGSGWVPIEWNPLPALRRRAPFELAARLELQDVAGLPIPRAQLRELTGSVQASVSLAGSIEKPTASAVASLKRGTLKLHGEFPPLVELEGSATLEGERLEISRLSGKIGGSEFGIEGHVGVAPPWVLGGPALTDLDLRLRSKKALLLRRPDLRVRGDLDLRWQGPWERSTLTGEVQITRAYYLRNVRMAFRGSQLPFDLFHLEDPPFRDLRFAIRVRSTRNIIVLNNLVKTRASANLHLAGTGLDPLLTGVISTDEGTVQFGNTRLRVRSAMVEFQEKDPYNPRLQIVLGEELRGYRASVTISGSLESPEVILDSTPPLEREKLLVLITTGQTLEQIERQGIDRFAAVEAAKYLGQRVVAYITRGGDPTEEGFFDRFRLETEGARRSDLEDLIRLEYRVSRNLLLDGDQVFIQSERDNYGDFNFNFGLRLEIE